MVIPARFKRSRRAEKTFLGLFCELFSKAFIHEWKRPTAFSRRDGERLSMSWKLEFERICHMTAN
eukprot:TRINITY_DN4383_c0_g1_i1.p1 TRINITY_DN4383_c0_g1~~TRINITY_DN4383_c0_g1_i1.p1  ORF type:complete len:65 (-),score=0.35 TRINITY_DN4383_c0_g1_i1:295-489(-)